MLHPAPAPATPADGQPRQDLPLLQVGVAAGLTSLPQLSGGVPQGYLRLLVFSRDSVLVSQQVQQLTAAALNSYDSLRVQVVVPQDGYVTAYVGNASEVDVLFDDVRVEHRPGLQVQEVHYDPAGLELAGLAPPSPGIKGLNNYRFNGKEFQPDLGLSWNHQDWRFFDPQLLRWHAVDPEVENGQESWTPYAFGFDNAVRFADANGRQGVPAPNSNPAADIRKLYHTVRNSILGRIATMTSTSSKEQAEFVKSPISTAAAYPYVAQADNTANSANLGTTYRGFGSKANALRHAFGQALVSRFVNPKAAKSLGDIHEGANSGILTEYSANVKQLTKSGATVLPASISPSEADSFVDQLNNQAGRAIAASNPKATDMQLESLSLQALAGNNPRLPRLYQFSINKDNSYTVSATQLSTQQYQAAQTSLQAKSVALPALP